jgi:hypothetical protein|tara:strand:- start:228 stop:611 length:384 start_codon:yes stop_codon:yes gene_type:complete
MRSLVILLLVSSSLAGCAEMIPDPPVEGNDPIWTTEYHNFTYEDTNNSTMPIISFGSNDTLVDIFSASVTLYNETVNLTVDMKPYFSIGDMSFQTGVAPDMGEVTLNLIELHGYDYNCTVVYRLWEL